MQKKDKKKIKINEYNSSMLQQLQLIYQNTLHQLHHAEETLTHHQPTVLLPLYLVLAVVTAIYST